MVYIVVFAYRHIWVGGVYHVALDLWVWTCRCDCKDRATNRPCLFRQSTLTERNPFDFARGLHQCHRLCQQVSLLTPFLESKQPVSSKPFYSTQAV